MHIVFYLLLNTIYRSKEKNVTKLIVTVTSNQGQEVLHLCNNCIFVNLFVSTKPKVLKNNLLLDIGHPTTTLIRVISLQDIATASSP